MEYTYSDENYANSNSTEYIENYTGKVVYQYIGDTTTIHYFSCQNATFRIDLVGRIYWNDGIFETGEWVTGTWEDGTWNNGTWYGGTWVKGTFNNGIIYKISWSDGIFNNGLFGAYKFVEETTNLNQTEWTNGTFYGGVFNGDIWRNGTWYDSGYWLGGNWIQGYDQNGIFTGTSPVSKLYNGRNLNSFSGFIEYFYFNNNTYIIENFECINSSLSIDNTGIITITSGTINNGTINNGNINNAILRNIQIENGIVDNSSISDSIINNGTFKNSSISNSVWNNGLLINSNISTSNWHNGTFQESIFRTGNWYNGTFESGDWYTNDSFWYDGIWISGNIDNNHSDIAPYIKGNGNYLLDFTGKLSYIYNTQTYIIKCKNATLQIDENGSIQWEDGTWEDGTWNNGIWNGGIFQNSVWNNGIWNYGTFINSTWYRGTWNTGEFQSGTWYNGDWYDGTWYNGIWNNGTWHRGTWHNGTWNNGNWITLYSLWFGGNWNGGLQNGVLIDGELVSDYTSNILKSISFDNNNLDSYYKIQYTLTDLGITRSTEIFIVDNNGNDVTNQIQHNWSNGILTIQFSDVISGNWKIQYYINIENKMMQKSFDNNNLNANNQIIFSFTDLDINSSTDITILDNNNNFVPTKNEENYTGTDFYVTYYWNVNNLILQFHKSFTGTWKIQYYKVSGNQNAPRLNIIDENTVYYDSNNNLYSFTGEFRFIIEKEDSTIDYYPIKVKNAQFILEQNGFIKWYNGEFEDGIWYNGIWNVNSQTTINLDDNFEINTDLDIEFDTNDDTITCIWHDGTWLNGDWYYNNSLWIDGLWITGRINNIDSDNAPNFILGNNRSFEDYNGSITYYFEKQFHNFECEHATFSIDDNGKIIFENGTWLSGEWMDGEWYGIVWMDGIWNDGIWNCGHWYNGVWNGGTWKLNDRYYLKDGNISIITEQGCYIKIGEEYSETPPLFGFIEDKNNFKSYLLDINLLQSIIVNKRNEESEEDISSSSSTSSDSSYSSHSSNNNGDIYDVKYWAKSVWHEGFIKDVKSYEPPIYEEANNKSYSGFTGTLVYKIQIYEEDEETGNNILKYWQYYKLICVSAIASFSENGYITWNYGNISGGIWVDGTFINGEFSGEEWYNGTWNNGTWRSGVWHDGTWNNGTWLKIDSVWLDGIWNKGYIDGVYSEMSPSVIIGNDNIFSNYTGYINYKVLINESSNVYRYYWLNVSNASLSFDINGYITWHRGTMRNGTWYDGIWKNQHLEQNEWKDTNSITSIWENGLFLTGTWENGNWLDGEWYVDNDGNYTGIWKTGYINGILSNTPPVFDFITEDSENKIFINYTGRLKYKYQNINNYNELNTDYNIIICNNADFEIHYNKINKKIGNNELIYYEPFIVWNDGTWNSGTWYNGVWKKGTWNDGTWRIGSWLDGTWNSGTFTSGMWYKGTWKKGTSKDRRTLNIFSKIT